MRLSPTFRRFAVYAVLVAECTLGCNNHNTTWHGRSAAGGILGGIDFGAVIYEIAHARMAPPEARALEGRRADFVGAIDVILDAQSLRGVGPTIEALFGLVDDGTLPRMAGDVAAICDALVQEPGQATLRALVLLKGMKSPIVADDAVAFSARLADYPEIGALFSAVGDLIGRDPALVASVETMLARTLRSAAKPPAAGAGASLFAGIGQELLVDTPPRGTSFGAPAFAVRVDANGNAAVAVDPASGKLYAPFIDANGDGAADVNAAGDPVDAQGRPIAISPFGTPGAPGRDAAGLALAPDGRPLYAYFDAKTTLLSNFLQLFGEALRRGIHDQALDVLTLSLGARAPDNDGTPFTGFAHDNPLLDVAWGGLELLKAPEVPGLFRAIAALERQDPALVERVLVTYGRIVEGLRPISSQPPVPPSAAGRARTDRLIALFDEIFNRGARPSTARLLLDLLHDLGRTARVLPGELGLMIDYKKLAVDSHGAPIPGQSQIVDFTLPPTLPGSAAGENRSILHQLLDLFTLSDSCSTFVFAGKPLSESLVELMAGLSVGTVQSLIDYIDNPIVRAYVAIDCPAILDSLDAVKGLAASGALAGFLPIAKVFVDHGETRLFVDLLKLIDASYDALRAIEPQLAQVLESGAFDAIFDLDDLLVAGVSGQAVTDPVSGTRAVDLLADALARALAHPAAGVVDRGGAAHATMLHLVVDPLRRIEDQIFQAGAQAITTSLYLALTDLFVERVNNAQLRNASLAPFIAHALDLLARNLPQDDARRAAALAGTQQDAIAWLESSNFAAIVDLATTLRADAGGGAVRDAVVNLLTPDLAAPDDAFGGLAKILAHSLQTSADPAALRAVAGFAATLFDPQGGILADLVAGLARIFAADRGATVLVLLRNALDAAPPGAGLGARAPISILTSVIGDVRAAGAGAGPADAVAAATAGLADVASFIRDPQGGVGRIFAIIKGRHP